MSSGESLTSSELTASSRCSTLVAPIIGAQTPLWRSQAKAIWDTVTPCSFAISSARSTTSKSSGLKNLSAKYLSDRYLGVSTFPPRLYLPVRKPRAIGAPRNQSYVLVFAEGYHLMLFLAIAEVVVVLHRDKTGNSQQVACGERFRELPGKHARGAYVIDCSLSD